MFGTHISGPMRSCKIVWYTSDPRALFCAFISLFVWSFIFGLAGVHEPLCSEIHHLCVPHCLQGLEMWQDCVWWRWTTVCQDVRMGCVILNMKRSFCPTIGNILAICGSFNGETYDNDDQHGMEWGTIFSEKTNRWRGVQTLGNRTLMIVTRIRWFATANINQCSSAILMFNHVVLWLYSISVGGIRILVQYIGKFKSNKFLESAFVLII